MSKGRVLVAMSGGIDSSMAALLLHEQGYEVIGITMKTWDYAGAGGSKKETGCCSLDSINDARSISVTYGFPHMVLDMRQEFGDSIINNFVDEYLAGRTPNPCVLCNTYIKWDALLRRADQLKCEFIATGHYARIRQENERFILSKGLDDTKDQSYVLWGLTQESLKRTIFPLANLTKKEVRKIAMEKGFADLANKSESYEICFIPDNDYREFLRRRVPDIDERAGEGNFVLADGTIVGKHKGYPFYTIGQRKGLEIAVGEPLYVTKISAETNTVTLGSADDVKERRMKVKKINLIKYDRLPENFQAVTRIRHKDSGKPSTANQTGNDSVEIFFHDKVSAITPGQSAVFYEGEDVVGGGIIENVLI
ncbi:MAG: tRNA 2-thiouridine(34) synthase MnmA [Bacteroidetes bacterium]|nr:MAG: tRNA 2-thiouridine(34) synthase MnmA [Bacteroidota bacterium]